MNQIQKPELPPIMKLAAAANQIAAFAAALLVTAVLPRKPR